MKKLFCLLLALSLLFSFSITSDAAPASTGIYLGSGTVSYGTVNYTVKGYVYYNSNTSTALDIYSLCEYVTNNCSSTIDEEVFRAHDAAFNKDVSITWPTTITNGNTVRLEQNWYTACTIKGYSSTSFTKNSYVTTQTSAGFYIYGLGGWFCDWFSSYRSANFYY